jgi:hypothetical protein
LASDQKPAENREWRGVIVRRWTRLHQTIASQEECLDCVRTFGERRSIEVNLRLLKRAALSVWLDAQAAGVDLRADPLA